MSEMTVDAALSPAAAAGVSYDDAVRYWSAVPATVDGMLGGYGSPASRVPRLDIAHSKRFLATFYPIVPERRTSSATTAAGEAGADRSKRRRLSQATQADGAATAEKAPKKLRCVDCGAGIGRVSRDLLVHFADTIDIVEPCRPLCEAAATSADTRSLQDSGKLANIHVCGVQDFDPTVDATAATAAERGYDVIAVDNAPDRGARYDFIWNQWCLGQLDDAALVSYLKRCKAAIGAGAGTAEEDARRYVFVKENVTGPGAGDIFDVTDSSWTRAESSFLRIFDDAGLKVVRSSWQHGFPKELFRVKVWALK